MLKRRPILLAIQGPTASGKSELAEFVADRLNCKILNADAFQMYRGLDIGTNKPRSRDRYLLLDVLDVHEPNSVGKFLALARPLVKEQIEQGSNLVVCGGTGLYVRALLDRYAVHPPPDRARRELLRRKLEEVGPDALLSDLGIDAQALPLQTRKNPVHLIRAIERRSLSPESEVPEWNADRLKIVIAVPRAKLRSKIQQRTERMIAEGWMDEVAGLMRDGACLDSSAFRAIGYREIAEALAGRLTKKEAADRIVVRTQQYAKRQVSWLRAEKGAFEIPWVDCVEEMAAPVCALLG